MHFAWEEETPSCTHPQATVRGLDANVVLYSLQHHYWETAGPVLWAVLRPSVLELRPQKRGGGGGGVNSKGGG